MRPQAKSDGTVDPQLSITYDRQVSRGSDGTTNLTERVNLVMNSPSLSFAAATMEELLRGAPV